MGRLVIVCIGGALGSGVAYALAYLAITVFGCLVTGTLGLLSARVLARVGSGFAV